MPLTPAERTAVLTQATVFTTGYGSSLADRTPTTVVAQMRGAQFEVVRRDGVTTLYPRWGEHYAICDAVVYDLAQATGCPDRVSYMELLETLGQGILAHLQEEPCVPPRSF